jgi:NTE family protein
MRHCLKIVAFGTLLLCHGFAITAAQPLDSLAITGTHTGSVGLVLSGGGAKGIAHIGVIQALEDNNIPIDYITGTSMGSIVGGLYAAGYSPREMLQLIESRPFSYWSTGKNNPDYVYYFIKDEPTPSMFHFPISVGDKNETADEVPASLISPLPMNFAFMELFSAYTAQCHGDFNQLFVPFRCVASDVEKNCAVVHASGDLGDAIRTSMSFPIVFQPIRVDGQLLYDGGIFDNFPVDVMKRDFAPDFTIGVDVSTPAKGPRTSLMDQVENLVTHRQSYYLDPETGIKLKVDLHKFGLLDFEQAEKIYQVGYDYAMSMMDSIKSRVGARMPRIALDTRRAVFKSQTPYVRFDSINVSGATRRQNNYIKYLFTPAKADTFGIVHARESYYRAITPGRLKDLSPRAIQNDSTGLFKLDLKATVKNSLNVGVGGYLTSSTNSYVYAEAGYKTMSSTSIAANLAGWLGQSYMAAQASGSVTLSTAMPSSLGLDIVASRQRFYESEQLFYESQRPTFVLNHEYYARLKWDVAARQRGKITFGLGIARLNNSFYRSSAQLATGEGRDHTTYNLAQALVRYTSSTLDNVQYPTSGYYQNVAVMGVLGRYHYNTPTAVESNIQALSDGSVSVSDFQMKNNTNQHWLQAEWRSRNYFDLDPHFSLGVEADVLYSTRPLLDNYNATIVNAPAFLPTPASNNTFNPALRSNSFIGLTAVPVYKYSSALSARTSLSLFMPMRAISSVDAPSGSFNGPLATYDGWFKPNTMKFFGELDINYALPFANLTAYATYTPTLSKHWSVGISFGFFLLAPKFLR